MGIFLQFKIVHCLLLIKIVAIFYITVYKIYKLPDKHDTSSICLFHIFTELLNFKVKVSLKKYNVRVFLECFLDFILFLILAIQASVLSRETAGNWIKFTIHVMQVYKQGPAKVHRGTQFLWVSVKDLACKCPKIRIKQTYLILGKHYSYYF